MSQLPDLYDLESFQGKDPQQALDAALAQVQSYCGWAIAPSQSATVSVWSDGCTLLLPTLNLTAVTSVTQDGVLVPSSSYTFERYGVIRAVYGGALFSKLTKVTVVFVHGYASLPDDAASVVLSLAQRSLTDTRGLVVRPGSATSASAGQLVETYGPVLTAADKEKLAPYARADGFA